MPKFDRAQNGNVAICLGNQSSHSPTIAVSSGGCRGNGGRNCTVETADHDGKKFTATQMTTANEDEPDAGWLVFGRFERDELSFSFTGSSI
jgi:hypothetical protein